MKTQKNRVAMIGCGKMGQGHIKRMLQQPDTTEIVAVCEPAEAVYRAVCDIFNDVGLTPPPNQPDFGKLTEDYGSQLDAVFIITPHVYHFEQTKRCLEAGFDVLLEKPMVVTAQEAIDLIKVRDKTGKLLVIAFNSSLSPQIRAASRLLKSGQAGEILNINAMVWENWSHKYEGHWKQNREVSGGGFLFDCGAHMLNTVSDLVGEAFTEVTAWLDNRDKTIDIIGSVMARTESGILVSMTSCGEVIPSIGSDVHIFCTEATIRTGIWGERLQIQRRGESGLTPVEVPPSLGVWEQFLSVRKGEIENPSPPEIGLRMALLWDAIQESATNGGALIKMKPMSALVG